MKTFKIILALLLATLLLNCTAEETAVQSTDCQGCVVVIQRAMANGTWEDTNEVEESDYPCFMHGHGFDIHEIDDEGYYLRRYVKCY